MYWEELPSVLTSKALGGSRELLVVNEGQQAGEAGPAAAEHPSILNLFICS